MATRVVERDTGTEWVTERGSLGAPVPPVLAVEEVTADTRVSPASPMTELPANEPAYSVLLAPAGRP